MAPAPPGSLAGLPSGGVAAGLGGPARPAADDSSFSRLFCTLRAMQAAKRKSWFGELWRPLAALLLWAVGIVAAHAAPPLLPSLVETRIGGLTAFPVDCIPAAPLFSSDLTRACGPPLYDLASDCSVAANRGGTALDQAGLNRLNKFSPANDGIPNLDPTYARPSGYRAGTRDAAWGNAKTTDGSVIDPLGSRIDPSKPWDMGHRPGFKFEDIQRRAAEEGWLRETFLNYHNNPLHYRPELPSTNRSHVAE